LGNSRSHSGDKATELSIQPNWQEDDAVNCRFVGVAGPGDPEDLEAERFDKDYMEMLRSKYPECVEED
jgi:hypothetical protein